MAKRIAKVSYDAEEDILYVRLDRQMRDSLEVGDFTIDFSADDRVVGLEIANASRRLSGSLPGGANIPKLLSSIRTARFAVIESRGLVWIRIAYAILFDSVRYEPSLEVPVPQAVLAR